MGALFDALLRPLFESVGAKLAFVFLALWAGAEKLVLTDGRDALFNAAAHLLIESKPSQAVFAGWLAVIWQAVAVYWVALALVLAAAVAVTAAAHVPLAWRAATARRRSIFISFQNQREATASEVASTLGADSFRVLRVPYRPEAGHQGIVVTVNEQLRRANAVVCLPGTDASFVDAEVAAATVARKPIVFLLAEGGTLPNTADKQHPVFDHARTASAAYAPLAEFLHFVTQDLHSAQRLYRAAWTHPALGTSLFGAASILALVSLGVFAASLIHAALATSGALPASLPSVDSLRWRAIWLMAVALLLAAVVVLPLAAWLALVTRSLWRQMHAARRAAIRVRAGEFARADWSGLLPGMAPGEPLFESLRVAAPPAHHEAARGVVAATPAR